MRDNDTTDHRDNQLEEPVSRTRSVPHSGGINDRPERESFANIWAFISEANPFKTSWICVGIVTMSLSRVQEEAEDECSRRIRFELNIVGSCPLTNLYVRTDTEGITTRLLRTYAEGCMLLLFLVSTLEFAMRILVKEVEKTYSDSLLHPRIVLSACGIFPTPTAEVGLVLQASTLRRLVDGGNRTTFAAPPLSTARRGSRRGSRLRLRLLYASPSLSLTESILRLSSVSR